MSFARLTLGFLIAVWLLLVGCRRTEPIVEYTVLNPEAIDPTLVAAAPAAAVPSQTLGAMTLEGETGWFFKLTGDPKQVAPQREAFVAFIKSIKFTRGEPAWDLPSGWKSRPASGLRFATIEIPAEPKPLELTVIPLPKGGVTTEEFVLSNVNRWRDQVSLPAHGAGDLKAAKDIETLEAGGHEWTLVDVTGESQGGGMGGAPFAPFAAGSNPTGSPTPAAGPLESASSELDFDKPAGWQEGQQDQFSKLAFEITGSGQAAKVTVTQLGPGAGDIAQNVNRWRGQVGLPPATAEELAADLKAIETLGTTGKYVELTGPAGDDPKAMLGVIAPTSEGVWFVKLSGNPELVQREKANFEAFAKSLKVK